MSLAICWRVQGLQFQVSVRFYAELGELLAAAQRGRAVALRIQPGTTTKAAIEHFGVPHTEVDLVLVDGESVDFAYQLQQGQRVSAFPRFTSIDVASLSRVRPAPLAQLRFLVDANLLKLARLLRMCGVDAEDHRSVAAAGDDEDALLVAAAQRQGRVLLTRDRRLLVRRALTHACFVRPQDPELQLRMVLRRFGLRQTIRPFTRCMVCNGALQPVTKGSVVHQLPPLVRSGQHNFSRCVRCRRLYWPGTHWLRMQRMVARALAAPATE